MVKLTLIARVADGLPLAEGLDDGREQKELETYKLQAKNLFKRLSQGQQNVSRMSIETGPFYFHYIIESGVCYLTLCDRSYPKKLAYQYLQDLQREFERLNRPHIETVGRPYAFVRFDTFIQKTRKQYIDTQTQKNIARLNDDLIEVHQIMTKNIQDILGTGEKLDYLSNQSSRLSHDSRAYKKRSEELSRQALINKWMPVAIVSVIVLFLLLLRYLLYK